MQSSLIRVGDPPNGRRVQEVQGSTQAGGKQYQPLRRSRNGQGDAPQVVSGLAVTRDGFPVRHWVFPGNTVDVETVQQVQRDLDGWRLTRLIFVGDAGMVSEKNLQALAAAGGRYLVGQPLRQGTELYEQVLSRPGRYRTVSQNLQVKQVTVGNGERRRRYTVCFSPEEAKRHRKQREQVLAELQAKLTSLAQKRCEAIKRHQQAATKESRTTGKVVTRKSKTQQAAARKVEYLRSFGLFGLWQLWQSSGPGGRVHFMIAEKSSDVKVKRVRCQGSLGRLVFHVALQAPAQPLLGSCECGNSHESTGTGGFDRVEMPATLCYLVSNRDARHTEYIRSAGCGRSSEGSRPSPLP